MSEVRLRVISLGAGVQSTTMALMAAAGELTPMPDCAIFADTGWEPKRVYEHLAWLMSPNVLPFVVHKVSAGNIKEDLIRGWTKRAGQFVNVPFHLREYDKPGEGDGVGIGRRQCTGHYKISPIRLKERELLGVNITGKRIPPGAVEKWIGISTDEIFRVRPSDVKFETNRHPLIEARMSRGDCLEWLKRHDYPQPPKSSCIGCPLHNNGHWREMREHAPEEWADALEMDEFIRHPRDKGQQYRSEQFMHYDAVPLKDVDLSTKEDHGQLNLFNNECQGMCGV